MSECDAIDHLITPFVDDELSGPQRAIVGAHLESCAVCRREVEVESTARHMLRAHAAAARTMGITPAWRPRRFRLGQPQLSGSARSLAAAALVAAALGGILMVRPRTVEAVGVISDSACAGTHRHSPNDAEARGCVLNCIEHGAQFVLVSGSTVYRIENQAFPDLAAFANLRVNVTATIGHNAIRLSRLHAADPPAIADVTTPERMARLGYSAERHLPAQ